MQLATVELDFHYIYDYFGCEYWIISYIAYKQYHKTFMWYEVLES